MRRRLRTRGVTRLDGGGVLSSAWSRYRNLMKLWLTILMLCASVAHAQSPTTGAIAGRVVEAKSKEPMPGVSVTARGTIEQTAFTDEDGRYKITELPPGEYVVAFEAVETTLTRKGVRVSANETTSLFQSIKFGEVVEMFAPPAPIDVT